MTVKSPAAQFDPKFTPVFDALKQIFADCLDQLRVTCETPVEYTLSTRIASPFPQHKGQPVFFGRLRLGKAYVSFHLFPLYIHSELTATISPALKKRMQGKTCFHFKTMPDAELLGELKRLAEDGLSFFRSKQWA